MSSIGPLFVDPTASKETQDLVRRLNKQLYESGALDPTGPLQFKMPWKLALPFVPAVFLFIWGMSHD